jgi:putative SOS response-associated peptidase YedK
MADTCGEPQDQLGAFLGALASETVPAAPDLAAILSAWPNLPEPVKAGIMAMVKAVNASAETVAEKPAFRSALRERRCIVMADGFYEWDRRSPSREPYYVTDRDKTPLGFAGLWDRWQRPESGEPIESCTIITTAANKLIGAFHSRMPVILYAKDYDLWLDPMVQEAKPLVAMLKQWPAKWMEAHPISSLVNSSAHESPDCVTPVAEAQP